MDERIKQGEATNCLSNTTLIRFTCIVYVSYIKANWHCIKTGFLFTVLNIRCLKRVSSEMCALIQSVFCNITPVLVYIIITSCDIQQS